MKTRILIILLMLVPIGCAGLSSERRKFEQTLYHYAGAVRWGDIEQILGFHAPARIAERPPESIELERWRQLRVTGYRPRGQEPQPDGTVVQYAQIEFMSVHTQSTFAVVDREVWRYDEQAKRWWLESGLPNLDQRL